MAFSLALTSVLSGATPAQLRAWREKGLIVPEIRPYRPPLYSMRDVIAVRAVARMRENISLQKIHKAFQNLGDLYSFEHLSEFKFGTDGKTIFAMAPGDEAVWDILEKKGQGEVFTFAQLTEEFFNFRNDPVVNLRRPRPLLSVDAGVMGGMPCIAGTRVPYSVIAEVVDGQDITVDNVREYYPNVSPDAARDALSFDSQVKAVAA